MHKSTREILTGMLAVSSVALPLGIVVGAIPAALTLLAAWVIALMFLILRAVERITNDAPAPPQPAPVAVPEGRDGENRPAVAQEP